MIARCPKYPEDHKKFITTIHEQHDALVDESGNWLEDKGTLEISTGPESDNYWECYYCGAEAIVEED